MKWSSGMAQTGKYEAKWIMDQREQAKDAERAFAKLIEKEFRHGSQQSVKFVFQKSVHDGVEMAYRLRELLGPSQEPLNVELLHCLETQGCWKQPHVGKWFAKTHGNDDRVCLTLSVPKRPARSTVETVSVQCDMRKGQWIPGARYVTVQARKNELLDFAAAWVMTFGPVD